jgi:hypothetical protein
MKPPFIQAIDDAVEKYLELPSKFIDTRFDILVQVVIICLIGLTNLHLQRFVIDSCITPVIPTPSTLK